MQHEIDANKLQNRCSR
ncbi:unnamed protein product [Amaranthus hypochondriacus]